MASQDELHQPILNSDHSAPQEQEQEHLSSPVLHEVDSRLEKVLSDTQLPSIKRLRLATWIELNHRQDLTHRSATKNLSG